MPVPNPGWNVVYGEIPAASKWSQLGANDDALAAGTGISDDAILTRHILAGNVTVPKLFNPYKFSAYCSTGKAITNNTLIVDLQTELFDPNNNFASSRYTAPVTGYYQINAQAWCGVAGAGDAEYCQVQIRKNGTTVLESQRENGSNNANRLMRPRISSIIQLNATDYIEMWVGFQGSRDIVSGQLHTWMNGFLVP